MDKSAFGLVLTLLVFVILSAVATPIQKRVKFSTKVVSNSPSFHDIILLFRASRRTGSHHRTTTLPHHGLNVPFAMLSPDVAGNGMVVAVDSTVTTSTTRKVVTEEASSILILIPGWRTWLGIF